MRSIGTKYILLGILLLGPLGCNPPNPSAPSAAEAFKIPPPPGWRVAGRQIQKGRDAETFLPKQRRLYEKMSVDIFRQPETVSKSTDELLAEFKPRFICQSEDLNILKKDPNEVLFEQKNSVCYGKPYRLTIARITKGRDSVFYYGYRADRLDLPDGEHDFILKTLTSAPMDTDGAVTETNTAASASAASASANPSAGAPSH
jgi:hypothetical protein